MLTSHIYVHAERSLNLAIRNTKSKEYVAIKILKASRSLSGYQSNIYSQLSNADKSTIDAAASSFTAKSSSWTQFIVPLLSSFTHIGPNGNHICLVFEPMGCSVSDFLLQRSLDALHFHDTSISGPISRGLETHQAKSTLRHILAALTVLHSRGLIHGDLHVGNVLFPLRVSQTNLEDQSTVFMPQDPENEYLAEKVRRRDKRELDKNAPRYLIAQESLIPYTALEDDPLRPKLIDVQGHAPDTGLHNRTPICLQSPELALEGTATESQDIWAFGFAIFEVLSGIRLFQIDTLHTSPEAQIDKLMLRFSETLGPLTSALKMKWKHYSEYFDDDCRRNKRMPHDRMEYSKESEEGEGGEEGEDEVGYESDVDSNGSLEFGSIDMAALEADIAEYFETRASDCKVVENGPDPISPLLEDVFDCFKPTDMSSKESDAVKSLLRRIFQYEPEKRPQAVDLQKDPWFAGPEDMLLLEKSEPDRQSAPQEERKGKRKRSSKKHPRSRS
jgi:serine/threonine protein kinase